MNTRELARRIRCQALRMVSAANASHIGSGLSLTDILAVLYGRVLRHNPQQPDWPQRDRVLVSKGHASAVVYATLAHCGYLPLVELAEYGRDHSRLMAHVSHQVPGVEFSSGSLGHGLPVGAGRALAARRQGADWSTYVLLSDGEMDEGSNWEALMFAAHHRLGRLVAVIDYNKLQSLDLVARTLALEPLADKLRTFGWTVREIDGHDHDALAAALVSDPAGPVAVIAHTVKGKGVSYMEHQVLWHYRAPMGELLHQALREIGCDPARTRCEADCAPINSAVTSADTSTASAPAPPSS